MDIELPQWREGQEGLRKKVKAKLIRHQWEDVVKEIKEAKQRGVDISLAAKV